MFYNIFSMGNFVVIKTFPAHDSPVVWYVVCTMSGSDGECLPCIISAAAAHLAVVDAVFVESNGGTGEDGLADPRQPRRGRQARCHQRPGDGLSCKQPAIEDTEI